MPAFKFSSNEIIYLKAFFSDLNKTGNAYPTMTKVSPVEKQSKSALLLAEHLAPEKSHIIKSGLENLKTFGCRGCHTPFKHAAGPDLSLASNSRSREYMINNIKNGRGAMPPFGHLTDEQIGPIIDAIEFLGNNRDQINIKTKSSLAVLKDLPWFEF